MQFNCLLSDKTVRLLLENTTFTKLIFNIYAQGLLLAHHRNNYLMVKTNLKQLFRLKKKTYFSHENRWIK